MNARARRVFFLPALLLCLGACASHAGTVGGGWKRTSSQECVVWDPLPQADETITWSGACVDGKASGPGTEISRYRERDAWREERYIGEMRGGKLHGHGTLIYENGDRYEGEFVASKRVGRGTYTFVNGDRYEGEFRDDKRMGRGTFTYARGGRYEGEFVDGLFDGAGTFAFPDGSRYEGNFRGGMANGQGTLRDAKGDTITGTWVKGCLREGDRVAAIGTAPENCRFK